MCRLQNKVVTIKSWFTISDLNDVIVSFYSLEDFFNIEALQVKVYVIFCCEVPEYANAILISLWHVLHCKEGNLLPDSNLAKFRDDLCQICHCCYVYRVAYIP